MLIIERAEKVIMRVTDSTRLIVNRDGIGQTCGNWYQDNILDALWSEWDLQSLLACWLSEDDAEMQVWCPSCWAHPIDLLKTAEALDTLYKFNGTTRGINPEQACKELQYAEVEA